jgi:hypothetical protein
MIESPNPQRDHWQSRCFELCERDTLIIAVLARKVALSIPEPQSGTFVCPYCYLDTPHSAESHSSIADAIDKSMAEGIVISDKEKETLRLISRQCREHGVIKKSQKGRPPEHCGL